MEQLPESTQPALQEREAPDDAEHLLHELQSHHVELALQDRVLQELRQELTEAHDSLAVLYEFAPVGYLTLDVGGRILSVNRAAAALLGRRRSHLPGRPFAAWLCETDAAELLGHLGAVFRSRLKAVTEVAIEGVDRKPVLVRLESMAVGRRGGGARKCLTAMIDVSECRRAELALRDSEERLRQITDHIREVFWISDAATRRVLYVSPAYEEIWGRPRPSLYQNARSWLQALHPEDRVRVQRDLRTSAGDGVLSEEFRIVRPDGSIRWISARGFAVRNDAGEVYRFAGTAEDITVRKHLEIQIQERQAELAHVARLAVAGEMASELAHELNQPLGAILTYVQIGLRMLSLITTAPKALREALEQAVAQSKRAGEIIRRWRNLVRKTAPQRSAADIDELIRETAALVEIEARSRRIEMRLELSGPLPPVWVDDIQIQQVLVNLMRNAIEAIDGAEGGERALLVQTLAVGDEGIEVAVTDTGPGLSAAASEELFQPFFTTKDSGMGLGLSISRSIIEAHGGRLWVTPNRGRGVTFRFGLPTVKDDCRVGGRCSPMPGG